MRNSRHIDASCGNIRGDENAGLAAAECLKRPYPGILCLVAVDGFHRQAGLPQKLADLIGAMLGASEDKHPIHGWICEQLDKQIALRLGRYEIDMLIDAVHGDRGRRDVDTRRIAEDFSRELGNVRRHGRREQKCLALLTASGDDLPYVADEAHVEHAVGLVEDENRDLVEIHMALSVKVEETARRGDQNVDALLQRLDLLALPDAAEDNGGAEVKLPAISAKAIVDLARKLARRRENKRMRTSGGARPSLLGQAMQNRQREGRGLAGAGLSDAKQIPALYEKGDRLRLDRRRLEIIFGPERKPQRLRQPKAVERRGCHL